MALPLTDMGLNLNYTLQKIPSKTWKIDLENETISTDMIDGDEAIKQATVLTLLTERGTAPIYSSSYGTDRLLDVDKYIREFEIQNNISEALTADDRISEVKDFAFSYPERGKLYVTFKIVKNDGTTVKSEEEINGVV